MSNSLECKAIRKTGDICVAQYLPCILKDEYFGIVSLLRYNMLRCKLTKTRELELVLFMSLLTILDKSNDGSWKRDPISKGGGVVIAHDDTLDKEKKCIYYEDPIPKKEQQKKYKKELSNEMKLQTMFEKEVRRSQKQIQSDQKRQHKKALSADNSPSQTPKTSPLPTPSSSNRSLLFQKSALTLEASSSSSSMSPITPTHNIGRLSKLFNSLSTMKSHEQGNKMSSQLYEENNSNSYNGYDHQLSLPLINSSNNTIVSMKYLSDRLNKIPIQNNNNPPSLTSIHWNLEQQPANDDKGAISASGSNHPEYSSMPIYYYQGHNNKDKRSKEHP
ncbi:uncharacterized protein BX663DRAFT_523754 [Cokeromyces recurvatus]|uniref:uncharacterized protein n=1 Tax=Cokeromyces recurvatus TaxID=90255 RepID=UPI0022201FCE|nr:uncharacterized protein BX663DRAFT_523754 [Cokeromyces recurvatus]KAI7898692.1 hypothetical protein BX663DRAFT_523754 [Cokeromyces recurvatus]